MGTRMIERANLTRFTLYESVWTQPMTKVAAGLRISDCRLENKSAPSEQALKPATRLRPTTALGLRQTIRRSGCHHASPRRFRPVQMETKRRA
jgi:hypothetical protein